MKHLSLSIIILINYFLKTSFFPGLFSIASPNTDLLITIFATIFLGRRTGATAGLIIGILSDVLFSESIGISSFSLFIIANLLGLMDSKIFIKKQILLVFLSLGSLILYNFIYYFIGYFFNANIIFSDITRVKLVWSIIFTTFFTLPVYFLFDSLYRERTLNFSE